MSARALRLLGMVEQLKWEDPMGVVRRPMAFIRDDSPDVVRVSAEDGNRFCNFYGQDDEGFPWIRDILIKWANDVGCTWEWENPGSIALYLK